MPGLVEETIEQYVVAQRQLALDQLKVASLARSPAAKIGFGGAMGPHGGC